MADLIVTFCRGLAAPPVMDGSPRRTEVVEITSSSAATELVAGNENIVDIHAGADCWVAIGVTAEAASPDSDGQTASGFMKSGERMQFKIATGECVAVIADS